MSEFKNQSVEELNVKIPDIIKSYSPEKQTEILKYLSELDEPHKKAYQIAFTNLGSSFNINRSNGFKEWKAAKSSK